MTVARLALTFDGSFQKGKGAGVGITLGYMWAKPFLEVSCPTASFDA